MKILNVLYIFNKNYKRRYYFFQRLLIYKRYELFK
jgi:hypothetical protein